ncbi:hypothetical protein Riv7116_5658 [Rivularia sp. PCC 7116]|uniref:ELWxxDGT repeat protein n=1 Tax=Rivularia sp. PCC 7116 TaxID=373994 RepID=UPI00029F4C95|nr:ELWxxDGT repeat protein [Rivularia sp. PCC 7116]AFY58026.1 hypothetical protein Riv7116_5658 [Rivularia sp. PCC 7116]
MGQNLIPSLIKDIRPGSASSNLGNFTSFNGNLAFGANNGEIGTVFQSDGTATGTVPISAIDVLFEDFETAGVTSLITGVGNKLFFTGALRANRFFESFLAATDGSVDGTSQVFGLEGSGNATGLPNDVTSIVDFEDFNGNLAFVAETLVIKDFGRNIQFRTNLVISDGTSAGTSVIKTFNPGETANIISEIVNVNGTLFFAAAKSSDVSESRGVVNQLWKSDGTTAGTTFIKKLGLSDADSNIPIVKNLTNINGTLFFSGEATKETINPESELSVPISTGAELFKSNGTESGTNIVKDINPEAGSNPDKITDVNGIAFFTADDGTNGTELWKSDGTQSGTVLVKDITPGSQGSEFDNLTNVNGNLFFTVNDSNNGVELWKSDGTESGTSLVKDINRGGNSSNPDNLTVFQDILYFTADDGINGVELWKSDGTESGTVLVGDINPGAASSNPEELTVVDGELYFSADDGVNGRELWGLTEGGSQPNQDLILGGDADDVLLGKEQDDFIDGLKGDDTLTGGSGKDIFVLSSEFGNDLITDFALGEDEIVNATSRIVFTTMPDGDSLKVAFSNTGDVLQVNLNSNGQSQLENYLLNIGSNQDLPY